MNKIDFLASVHLPALDGLSLAATATRALERFSDLAAGVETLAPLRPIERIDIMDECLDLVVPRPDLPGGFEFAGFSLAGFRAALRAARADVTWERVFRGPELPALREAARRRIAICPEAYLGQIWFDVPARLAREPYADVRPELGRLFAAAYPGWVKPRRHRLAVEMLEMCGAPGHRRLPVRGTRFPAWPPSLHSRWLKWGTQRLQPRDPESFQWHRELQLVLPSLETSYFSWHFPTRNIFAHLRVTCCTVGGGRRALILDEVQSDWMRDLRFQRQGRALPGRWTNVGQRRGRAPERVPDCPVERDWLAIAMDVLVNLAIESGATLIAWTPASIQMGLNPALPPGAAGRLYDRRIPAALAGSAARIGRTEFTFVDYPTYARNVLMQYRRKEGWLLVGPDGQTRASGAVTDIETVLQLHRIQARPVVERLPAVTLERQEVQHPGGPLSACSPAPEWLPDCA